MLQCESVRTKLGDVENIATAVGIGNNVRVRDAAASRIQTDGRTGPETITSRVRQSEQCINVGCCELTDPAHGEVRGSKGTHHEIVFRPSGCGPIVVERSLVGKLENTRINPGVTGVAVGARESQDTRAMV